MNFRYYKLVDRKPVLCECTDIDEWAESIDIDKRRVDRAEIGELDGKKRHYVTWDEAVRGYAEMVEEVKGTI